ncbi:MAG: RNA polymerase sigma factor [Mangrovibacterium sp.]
MDLKKSEIRLIRDFMEGNDKAFEKLFEIYHRRLYAFVLGLTHSKEDSEEIVQNAFIRIWENRAQFKEEYPFDAYLFSIARNAFLNYNRKNINRRIFEEHFEIYTELSQESTDQYVLFKETKTIIETLINAMPPKRREIFILQKIEGLSRKEISEKLNISVVTVDSHLLKANKQFVDGLKKFNILVLITMLNLCHALDPEQQSFLFSLGMLARLKDERKKLKHIV